MVDGKHNEDLFMSSFWLGPNCQLLRVGTPRSDFLLNEKNNEGIKERVRETLGIEHNSFFVLYAPTFREGGAYDSYISDFRTLQDAFEKKYGKTAIAVRLHPNLREYISAFEWVQSSMVIDATAYPDSDDLVIAADCVISDYSSIAFDFALIKKPVFLYMKDMDRYIGERGVYPIFYEQPFGLNTDMNMLIEEILNRSPKDYQDKLDSFCKKYPTYNKGNASALAVDWLISKGLKQTVLK